MLFAEPEVVIYFVSIQCKIYIFIFCKFFIQFALFVQMQGYRSHTVESCFEEKKETSRKKATYVVCIAAIFS